MKDKLKIKIWNYKNVVLYEVLEQDEELRGKDYLFRASNGWEISSYDYPDISPYFKSINIRGDDTTMDKYIDASRTETTKEAKQIVKEVKQAVKEFNESFKQILTNKEKEYLRTVIKPFKNKVRYIEKIEQSNGEFISIVLKNYENIGLPYFEKNTMYKGMEQYKEYTLEELGL